MSIPELEYIPKSFKDTFEIGKNVGIVTPREGHRKFDVRLFQAAYNASDAADDLSLKQAQQVSTVTPPPATLSRSSSLSRDGLPKHQNSMPQPPTSLRQFSDTFNSGEARFVDPRDLFLNEEDGMLHDIQGPLEQFALECDQDLLLQMDDKVLERLLCKSTYINDIRTVLIAHDKRLLSVLTNRTIMSDYLSADDVECLQRFVVKTYIIGECPIDILTEIKNQRDVWLIKPNGSGKGEGIVFGSDCINREEWEGILDDPLHSRFVVQPVIKQQVFPLVTAAGPTDMAVVGVLHNFHDTFLGPGIFRASPLCYPIVNIAGGKGIIMPPCVISSRFLLSRVHFTDHPSETSATDDTVPSYVPKSAYKRLEVCEKTNMHFTLPSSCQFKFPADDNFQLCNDILGCLITDGVVSIDTSEDPWSIDTVNDRLTALVSNLGILNAHSCSESDVWDVRPVQPAKDLLVPPRSQTAEEFPMHTDCSFEDIPPRYILLYVVEEDRNHGGLSTLVDSTVLLRYLSKTSLAALHKYEYEMKVPQEFFKGHTTVKGRILSAGKLWRYRSDTIVRTSCNAEQLYALDELDQLLEDPRLVLTTALKKGTIFLLDNSRWFHGRTAVYDEHRWLKRIRFHPREYLLSEPAFQRQLSRSVSLGIDRQESSQQQMTLSAELYSVSLDHSTSCAIAPVSNFVSGGIFHRLQIAMKLIVKLSKLCGDSSLSTNYNIYIRGQLKLLESLQYYVIDFTASPWCLMRHVPANPACILQVSETIPFTWTILQVANCIVVGSFVHLLLNSKVRDERFSDFFGSDYEKYLSLTLCDDVSFLALNNFRTILYSESCPLILDKDITRAEETVVVVLSSLSPSISDFCRIETKTMEYLREKYNKPQLDWVDEFDVLDNDKRAIFVQERKDYILACAYQDSAYYRESSRSSEWSDIPIIDGNVLLEHTHELLADNQRFNISFASGGTSGKMKFVYRSTWEDEENARYLAKGLFSCGVNPTTDVVCNTLSSGFWGGMHVFNLSCKYLGVSLIPISSAIAFDQCVAFLRQLRPNVLLTTPTWLVSFATYVAEQQITDLPISKVITGGEPLFLAARNFVSSVLKIDAFGSFLSTGYTSNETGIIGFRCRHQVTGSDGFFHIQENMQFVEIEGTDDACVSSNSGQIITTNLNRTLLPMIRYRIGDWGTIFPHTAEASCPCGRTLHQLHLQGRLDHRLRVAGRDLYVEEVSAAISQVPALSLHFSIHLHDSETMLGKTRIDFHLEWKELPSNMIVSSAPPEDATEDEFLAALFSCSCDFTSSSVWDTLSGIMDKPRVIFHKPGQLPRNSRTGKVSLVVDHRV